MSEHTRIEIQLDSPDVTDYACRECSTTTAPGTYLPWPCRPEQERVSAVLDEMMADSAQYYDLPPGDHQTR